MGITLDSVTNQNYMDLGIPRGNIPKGKTGLGRKQYFVWAGIIEHYILDHFFLTGNVVPTSSWLLV